MYWCTYWHFVRDYVSFTPLFFFIFTLFRLWRHYFAITISLRIHFFICDASHFIIIITLADIIIFVYWFKMMWFSDVAGRWLSTFISITYYYRWLLFRCRTDVAIDNIISRRPSITCFLFFDVPMRGSLSRNIFDFIDDYFHAEADVEVPR